MKKVWLTALLFIALINLFGQRNSHFLGKNDFPSGLEISIDSAKHKYLIDSDCLGHVTFSREAKAVTYHVLYYIPADSIVFKGILTQRLTMEDCQWTGNKKPVKSIPIYFVRGHYYFLSEFCACGSTSKGACGDLARRINKWLR